MGKRSFRKAFNKGDYEMKELDFVSEKTEMQRGGVGYEKKYRKRVKEKLKRIRKQYRGVKSL